MKQEAMAFVFPVALSKLRQCLGARKVFEMGLLASILLTICLVILHLLTSQAVFYHPILTRQSNKQRAAPSQHIFSGIPAPFGFNINSINLPGKYPWNFFSIPFTKKKRNNKSGKDTTKQANSFTTFATAMTPAIQNTTPTYISSAKTTVYTSQITTSTYTKPSAKSTYSLRDATSAYTSQAIEPTYTASTATSGVLAGTIAASEVKQYYNTTTMTTNSARPGYVVDTYVDGTQKPPTPSEYCRPYTPGSIKRTSFQPRTDFYFMTASGHSFPASGPPAATYYYSPGEVNTNDKYVAIYSRDGKLAQHGFDKSITVADFQNETQVLLIHVVSRHGSSACFVADVSTCDQDFSFWASLVFNFIYNRIVNLPYTQPLVYTVDREHKLEEYLSGRRNIYSFCGSVERIFSVIPREILTDFLTYEGWKDIKMSFHWPNLAVHARNYVTKYWVFFLFAILMAMFLS